MKDVEDEAGVSHMTIQRIEAERIVSFATFARICTWLDLPWDYFRAEHTEEV